MRFGVHIAWGEDGTGRADIARRRDEILRYVRGARDAGYDYVILGQHFLSEPLQMMQPVPLLARLIPESGDMRLYVTYVGPLQNPVDVVETANTMDVLSDGRFGVSFCLGYRDEEYRAFGVDPARRLDAHVGVIDAALRLWREPSVDASGDGFELKGAHVTLRSIQDPHPPVWIAGSAETAVKRAARWGLPWYVNAHDSPDDIARKLALYRAEAEASGNDPDVAVPAFRELFCARTREAALEIAAAAMHRQWQVYSSWDVDRSIHLDEGFAAEFEALARDRFIIGSPDDCAREIARYRDAGVDHLHFRMSWPSLSGDRSFESMQLLADEVLPRFR